MSNPDPTTLYRLYDEAGRLLYVGISRDPSRRFAQHGEDKAWWSEAATARLSHYHDRPWALLAEEQAIKTERPVHNIVHNTTRPSTPPAPRTSQAPDESKPNRLATCDQKGLLPTSLVGSYFHGTAARQWQGCVVAEPQSGVYLVELFSWLMGESVDQVLVPITDMMEWTFYDNAEWMCNAVEGVRSRWERERVEAVADLL